MVTKEDLKNQFPEFAKAGDILLDTMLAAASLEIDADQWGAKASQGQLYLTAHKLALSPFGNNARMVPTSNIGEGPHGQTTYGAHYDNLVRQVALGAISVA